MPLAECLIRPATGREIAEIERISVAAYAQYSDKVPPAIFDAYLQDLSDLAGHGDEAEVLVCELDGRIAGCVTFYADAGSEGLGLPEGWAGFRKLAVHPDSRGRGVGRKLVAKCIDMAGRLGAPTVGIHTASFMEAACRIYDQTGFRRSPEYDLRASDILGVEAGAADVMVIAYRLDLARR